MKRLFLSLVALGACCAGSVAQVTLEHTFSAARNIDLWPNGAQDTYMVEDSAYGTYHLYSVASQAYIRSIDAPFVANFSPYSVQWYGANIFTTNGKICGLINYAGPNGTYKTLVVDEDANTLATVEDCYWAWPLHTASGWKLLARIETLGGASLSQKVYSLPGTASGRVAQADARPVRAPFPNPAVGRISLPYQTDVPTALQVLDAQGRVVHTTQVGPAFDAYLLDASTLPAGVYTYQVGSQAGQRFVVR